MFRIVFRNILKNIVRIADSDHSIDIMIKKHKKDYQVDINFYSTNFDINAYNELFTRKVINNPGNPGYSLFLAKRIVELHKGTLRTKQHKPGMLNTLISLPKIE